MATAKVTQRLKALVLELSRDSKALHSYSRNPARYLRQRQFPEKIIKAISYGSRALQQLLAGPGKPPPVFLIIGVLIFKPPKVKTATKKKVRRS